MVLRREFYLFSFSPLSLSPLSLSLSLSLQVQELHDEIAKHKEDRTKMWTELVAEKERVTDLEER